MWLARRWSSATSARRLTLMGNPRGGGDTVLVGMFPFINIRRNMPVVKRAVTGRCAYASPSTSHPRRSLLVIRSLAGTIALVLLAGPALAQEKAKPRPKPAR